jgi:protein involved in polysaccharide export with SLBB domain
LGPDDQVKIWALGIGEIPATPQRIDPAGYVDLPVLGRIRAAGLSLNQFKEALLASLAKEVLKPQVSVEIAEFGSQPVTVMGAVTTPGVHQLRGRKTLAEVLSIAGGPRNDAGAVIKITRLASWGSIPLPGATLDSTGQYNVAEIGVKDFLSAKDPAQNILIRPNDVLAVPVAEMVYVIGAVRKPGGFGLTERGGISALHALSMAEGLGPTPAPRQLQDSSHTAWRERADRNRGGSHKDDGRPCRRHYVAAQRYSHRPFEYAETGELASSGCGYTNGHRSCHLASSLGPNSDFSSRPLFSVQSCRAANLCHRMPP